MYYYVGSCVNNTITIHRKSDEEEYKIVCELQHSLNEVVKHKRRFGIVKKAYDRIDKIVAALLSHSSEYDIEDFSNAFSEYMFSFKKFLDNWETYIKRTFGVNSDLYRIFKKSTSSAYDNHDEYKIIYQLRNADQHVDRIVDFISIGMDSEGTPCIKATADCSRLMQIYSKWKAGEKAHLQQHKSIDMWKYIKVVHVCITQIGLDLVNYFISEELYDSCLHILVKANEFFEYRKGMVFLCQEEEITKEYFSRPSQTLNREGWMVPDCIRMLESYLRNNIHIATILYHGKCFSPLLAKVSTEVSLEQIKQMKPGNKIIISDKPYVCSSVAMDLINQSELVLAVNAAIPLSEHKNIGLRFKQYTNALCGKDLFDV